MSIVAYLPNPSEYSWKTCGPVFHDRSSKAGAGGGDGVVFAREFLGVGAQAGAGAHVAVGSGAQACDVEVDADAGGGGEVDEAFAYGQWGDRELVAGGLEVDEALGDEEVGIRAESWTVAARPTSVEL
jgi:hypothetical protein